MIVDNRYVSGRGKVLDREEYIKRLEKTHGDKYEYSGIIYKNRSEDIEVVCKKHGIFKINASTFLSKSSGCYRCNIERRFEKIKEDRRNKEYIKKYGYEYELDIDDIDIKKSNMKVRCPRHNKVIGVYIFYYGKGVYRYKKCDECRKEESLKVFLSSMDYNKYDYSEVKESNNVLRIRCKKHDEYFDINKYLHKRDGIGCKSCYSEKRYNKFIKKAYDKYKDTYDYSLIDKRLFNSIDDIKIICREHGEFTCSSSDHIQYRGCPRCNGRKIIDIEDFKRESMKIHGDRYDYGLVKYYNLRAPVEIRCKTHGIFWQTPTSHIYGKSGCKLCNINSKVSNSEIEWLNSLNIPKRSYIISNYCVDGYDHVTNTIYEFLGDYWHGNLERYNGEDTNIVNNKKFNILNKETFDRLNYLKSCGYRVIYIWESDWKEGKNYNVLE